MPSDTPPPNLLTINKKKDHFFISINKQGPHAFLMLGLYKQNKVRNLLCRVGKFGEVFESKNPFLNIIYGIQCVCNVLFFSNKAHLEDEGIWKEDNYLRSISYQAYDITYEQYLEFVRVLETLQTDDNELKCYKPETINEDEITLKWTAEKKFPQIETYPKIEESFGELSVENTCRHSAIAFVEAIQKVPISSLVSSNFFWDLPYETTLWHGKPNKNMPFYVLPPPPATFHEADKAKESVLIKLYAQMEKIPILEPESQDTKGKFLKLKELYLDIVGPKKDLSLDELLTSIHDWKVENKKTLKVLRREYPWDSISFLKRKSSTMKLLSEIEDDLRIESENRENEKSF